MRQLHLKWFIVFSGCLTDWHAHRVELLDSDISGGLRDVIIDCWGESIYNPQMTAPLTFLWSGRRVTLGFPRWSAIAPFLRWGFIAIDLSSLPPTHPPTHKNSGSWSTSEEFQFTAFPASSRHGLRGADAKAVSCELYICNCQRHAEAQELETTNTYWLTHCSGFRAWVLGGQNWNEKRLQNKGRGGKRRHGTLYVSHEGTDWASHSMSSFLWWEWKGKRNALCLLQMAKASKKDHLKYWGLPSNQNGIHVALRRKV